MRARVTLLASLVLVAPLAGCLVPEDMPELREDLGYASAEPPELVVKARATTLTPAVGENVTLTAEVEGVPASNATLAWTVGGEAIDADTVERAFEQPGTVNATVTAEADGATARDRLSLDVAANEPPTVDLEVPDAGELVDREPVVLRADADDPDGDQLALSWTVDGEGAGEGASIEADLAAGIHRAQVEVTDGRATARASTTVAVAHAVAAEGTVSTTDDTVSVGFEAREGADGLTAVLEHTTTAGVDDVDLALVDADGETVATASDEPEPGASTATERLEVPADNLTPGAYTLEATLERGTEATADLEGRLAYAAGR
jgi:hypothetical protein